MDKYEDVGFFNSAMEPKYYDPQRHLKLEAALTELRDRLYTSEGCTSGELMDRLQKMGRDFDLAQVALVEPMPSFKTYGGGKTNRLGRCFTKVGGKVTVNAKTSDAS